MNKQKRYFNLLVALLIGFLLCLPASGAEAAEVKDIIYSDVAEHIGASAEAEWIAQAICYASSIYQVDPLLITAVMEAESQFDLGALSPKGAVGLMQLMPDTAEGMGLNPYEPLYNVIGGTLYLRNMLNKFAGYGEYAVTNALAAYNAGPQAVIDYGGCPPYSETINYVITISEYYQKLLSAYERS